jgi:hypothetical protein
MAVLAWNGPLSKVLLKMSEKIECWEQTVNVREMTGLKR